MEPPVSSELHWRAMTVCDRQLPEDYICRGKHIRFVMNGSMQYMFLDRFFPQFVLDEGDDAYVWLECAGKRVVAGTPAYCAGIGSMIRRRGLLANLSIRENLLLPFLYAEDSARLQRAEDEVGSVAEFLGIDSLLYEQAGERSAYTHALVSLGHCLLKRPDVIVAQEVHVGMPPERLQIFRDKVKEAMQQLEAGVLYLTSTIHEGSGLKFSRTYEIECDNVPDVSGIW
ncbi:MAG: hypothetical protein Q9M14_01800 [Mariprofundaceae bacterium]|nr:hypothetical protein [Mariprofundaceae bacterium]